MKEAEAIKRVKQFLISTGWEDNLDLFDYSSPHKLYYVSLHGLHTTGMFMTKDEVNEVVDCQMSNKTKWHYINIFHIKHNKIVKPSI